MEPAVKLSPGEAALIESIIEHIYPDPQVGSVLPVEHNEKRAVSGLARKGLVVLSTDERGQQNMTFTALGQTVYEQRLPLIWTAKATYSAGSGASDSLRYQPPTRQKISLTTKGSASAVIPRNNLVFA